MLPCERKPRGFLSNYSSRHQHETGMRESGVQVPALTSKPPWRGGIEQVKGSCPGFRVEICRLQARYMMLHHWRPPAGSPADPPSRRRLNRMAARASTPSSWRPPAAASTPMRAKAAASSVGFAGVPGAVSVQPPNGPGRIMPARLRSANSACVSTCSTLVLRSV